MLTKPVITVEVADDFLGDGLAEALRAQRVYSPVRSDAVHMSQAQGFLEKADVIITRGLPSRA